MIDNLAYPVWLRDEKLNLSVVNKKYQEFVNQKSKDAILAAQTEIQNTSGESISKNLALLAHSANKTKKQTVSLTKNGERLSYEVIETPFHADQSLDRIYSVGAMIDITELDELKRNLKLHQNSHLEILGALGTAFAVFDDRYKLAFYNKAFSRFWELEDVWLESGPGYAAFLDLIREKRHASRSS